MPDSRAGGGWDPHLPPLPPHLDPRGRRKARKQERAAQRKRSAAPVGPAGRAPGVRRRPTRTVARYRRGQVAMISTGVLAALLSAALLLFSGYAWWNFRSLNNGLQRIKIATGVQDQNKPDIDGKDQNLLLVGNDDRSGMTLAEVRALKVGRDGGSLSTDTMMIVHVPANGSKATLISLPRDSYVSIPGYGMNKLNAAYALAYHAAGGSLQAKRAAGADELVKTVTDLTGLTIDHYVQVSLLGFYRISNAIGGVSVNLCQAANDPYSGLHLSAGPHVIKGVTALEFVRQRHGLTNGDIDRTLRQRYFLTAAFRKIASAGTLLNPSKLSDLISAIKSSISVDDGLNIAKLAEQVGNLSANNITGKAIPFERYADTQVGSVEIVDPAKVKAFVTSLIGSSTDAYAKAKTVDPHTVQVSVLNGGAANGAAGAAAHTLQSAGFNATAGDSPTSSSSTTITYPSGMEAQARTLAQYVPGAAVRSGNVSGLTLTLGADQVAVHSSPVTHAPSPSSSTSSKPKPVDAGCVN